MSQEGRLAAVVAALVLVARPAGADVTKAQCVDANTDAQSLRRAGKFAEARAMLALCGDPQCPGLVRDDCTRQTDELNLAQPTMVFDARAGTGADLSIVRVTVDGRLLTEKLDGAPLAVDPGEHTFTFEVSGQAPVTQRFVVKEAERGRRERIVVGAPVVEDRPKPESKSPPERSGSGSVQSTLGIVGMGLGGAALSIGTIFGVLAASAWGATKNECGSPQVCPSYSQAVQGHGRAVTDGTVSTASLLGGGLMLGGGALLFFTAHATTVTPDVGPNAASLMLRGRF